MRLDGDAPLPVAANGLSPDTLGRRFKVSEHSFSGRCRLQAHAPTLLGHSPTHQRLLDEVALVGNSALTVLVLGETGVGKELVAQALHAASPRAARSLIGQNCAALPEHLVESELFGHVRGAFSGAVAQRRGKFELAHGGMLFLDEVGELPLAAQVKLLRVLRGGQLQCLGSDRDHTVDVRVVEATNRDPAEEVRADVYHRLSVNLLVVPLLRERGSDVLLLAGHFWNRTAPVWAWAACGWMPALKRPMLAHDWPGNVRELEHLVARSALKALAGLARLGPRPRIVSLTAVGVMRPVSLRGLQC